MIDTGMTRCGCSIDQLEALLTRIESHTSLRLVSLGSHFATAHAKDDAFMGAQFSSFCVATDALAARCGNRLLRTIANSGGIFFFPEAQLDMVRPGISLYGIDPTCRASYDRALRPVAKWTAPLVSILDAKQHTSVGYAQTWKSTRDTRVGLVPVGYADGYLRCFGNRASMIVGGVACPVIGRVSMDLASIDLHDVPSAKIGDEVIVMDCDPLSPASAYALAEAGQTIPYELFTRIGRRVKRVAVDRLGVREGEKVGT
jgi:alanine racemase